MNKSKKIISILAAATLTLSALTLTGCKTAYKGDEFAKDTSAVVNATNGGFVVESGDYVYFINGQESNTADNTYGEVVKGALMRISKADLAAGNYTSETVKTVVPSLFVAGTYDSGIYIYGDYVYYATPTTDKNNAGEIANGSLDFKRAKIDGTEAPMNGKNDYFFRLSSNTTKYRFVEENDVVYCLYEESSQLKSYNTKTGETTVLVKGAGTVYYDEQDLTNPNVYYTMSVTIGLDEENSTSQSYNQIYTVNAAASYKVDASNASYDAKDENGKVVATYAFEKSFLEKKNEEAKENDTDAPYDFGDYTTYPYVNLGKLVLDGIGSDATQKAQDYKVNATVDQSTASVPFGYTYAIQKYTNDGLYFTRKETTGSLTYLYYLGEDADDAAWNTVTGNTAAVEVSKNTTNASASALFMPDHSYFYLSGNNVCYVNGANEVTMEIGSGATLWKVDGDYLYYYGTGTNGKSVSRINYKGTQTDYGFVGDEDTYAPVTLPLVDFTDSWYKPEFVTVNGKTMLLYANAQTFGGGTTAYNNIYVATVGTNAEIKAANEKLTDINEKIDEYSENSDLQNLMKYYFRTGKTAAYEAVEDLYDTYQKKEFDAFKKLFTETTGEFNGYDESAFIKALGEVKESEVEAIDEAWASYLKTETTTTEEDGLPDWAIWLIVGGSVLVVGVAAAVTVIVVLKKKKAEKAKAESIVNAYKHKKIDTTDDKTIDVYAEEEPTVEEVETPVEESMEEVVEEAPIEESAEEVTAPAEENE